MDGLNDVIGRHLFMNCARMDGELLLAKLLLLAELLLAFHGWRAIIG